MSYLGDKFWRGVEREIENSGLSYAGLQRAIRKANKNNYQMNNARYQNALPSDEKTIKAIEKYLNCDLWVIFDEGK